MATLLSHSLCACWKTPRKKTPLTCAIDAAKREGLVPARVNESSAGRRPTRQAGPFLNSRSPRATCLLTTLTCEGIVEHWGCIEHPDITVITRALLIA